MSSRDRKLYALFQAIDKNLTVNEFKDHLKVQKIPYLAQVCGIKLGYTFSWYLKGPYSKTVAKDGFAIYEMLSKGKKPTMDENLQNDPRVQKFGEMIKPHVNDPTWLEIAASIIYLRQVQYQEEQLDQIIGYLIEDMTCGYENFDECKVRIVVASLMRIHLLS